MPEEQTEKTEQAEKKEPVLQTIIFSPIAQVVQVDDFPEDTERTIQGAFHVRPGATRVVTEAEAAHLKARGINFTVIGGQAVKPAAPVELPKLTEEQPAPGGQLFQGTAEGDEERVVEAQPFERDTTPARRKK